MDRHEREDISSRMRQPVSIDRTKRAFSSTELMAKVEEKKGKLFARWAVTCGFIFRRSEPEKDTVIGSRAL